MLLADRPRTRPRTHSPATAARPPPPTTSLPTIRSSTHHHTFASLRLRHHHRRHSISFSFHHPLPASLNFFIGQYPAINIDLLRPSTATIITSSSRERLRIHSSVSFIVKDRLNYPLRFTRIQEKRRSDATDGEDQISKLFRKVT